MLTRQTQLGPAPRVELALSCPADITSNDIVSDDELGSIVAIASGSQLEVHTEHGKLLLQKRPAPMQRRMAERAC